MAGVADDTCVASFDALCWSVYKKHIARLLIVLYIIAQRCQVFMKMIGGEVRHGEIALSLVFSGRNDTFGIAEASSPRAFTAPRSCARL